MVMQQAGGEVPEADLAGHSAPRHWFWGPGLRPGIGLAMDVPGVNRPGQRRSWWRQPWFRFLVYMVVLVVLVGSSAAVASVVGGPDLLERSSVAAAMTVGPAIAVLLLGSMVLERRSRPVEFDPARIGGLGAGLMLGTAMMLVIFGIIMALGGYRVEGTTTGYDYVGAILLLGVQAGIFEEIVFRWILFRLSEEYLGTWLAMLLSAAFFGFVHIGNPDGTVLGGVAIMLEAGLLFALLYALTRSLWLVVGLHAAWNVVQGPVLGITVSGAMEGGWLDTSVHGPEILSGGAFGAESTLVAVVVCLLLALWAARQLVRRGLVVAPVWVRRRRIREMTED